MILTQPSWDYARLASRGIIFCFIFAPETLGKMGAAGVRKADALLVPLVKVTSQRLL